jgi:hypothetical protein
VEPPATSSRSRLTVLFGALVVAHILLKGFLFRQVVHAPLHGDEVAYAGAGQALAAAVRALFTAAAVNQSLLSHAVVGNGWFMPGMPLVLAPLYLVDPGAGPTAARIYVGVLSTAVFLVLVFITRRVLGQRFALALLVFPGLVPMWLLFSYGLWADTLGGLLVLGLLLWLVQAARGLAAHRRPSMWQGVCFGLLAITALYLRSSTFPLVLGVLGLALVALLWVLRGTTLLRALAAWATALAVFVVLLAPWSLAASTVLGGRVITTTTVPISMAVAFGDPQELCFGPCPGDNIWVDSVTYSRARAAREGKGELAVQKEMSDHALRHLTPKRYATGVLRDTDNYLMSPAGFEPFFRPPDSPPGTVTTLVDATTTGAYFLFLALTVVSLLTVCRRPLDRQVPNLLLKLMLAALMVQPFVHPCSPRYWPVFAPLMALSAAMLVPRRTSGGGSVWLTRLQSVTVAGWVLGAVGLVVVAA